MTSAENIEELLDQIQNQTGIRFSITDSQIDDEELLITLKNMLRAGHSSTSKEGFLRGLLLGLLSDQEIAEGIHRFHLEKNGYFFPVLMDGKGYGWFLHIHHLLFTRIHQNGEIINPRPQ